MDIRLQERGETLFIIVYVREVVTLLLPPPLLDSASECSQGAAAFPL